MLDARLEGFGQVCLIFNCGELWRSTQFYGSKFGSGEVGWCLGKFGKGAFCSEEVWCLGKFGKHLWPMRPLPSF